MGEKQNLLRREWEPKEKTAKYINTLAQNNFSYMTTYVNAFNCVVAIEHQYTLHILL